MSVHVIGLRRDSKQHRPCLGRMSGERGRGVGDSVARDASLGMHRTLVSHTDTVSDRWHPSVGPRVQVLSALVGSQASASAQPVLRCAQHGDGELTDVPWHQSSGRMNRASSHILCRLVESESGARLQSSFP